MFLVVISCNERTSLTFKIIIIRKSLWNVFWLFRASTSVFSDWSRTWWHWQDQWLTWARRWGPSIWWFRWVNPVNNSYGTKRAGISKDSTTIRFSQEMESIKCEIATLRTQTNMAMVRSQSQPLIKDSELPALSNPSRVKKLTKFFGTEPPLIRLFLRELGYEVCAIVCYARFCEDERRTDSSINLKSFFLRQKYRRIFLNYKCFSWRHPCTLLYSLIEISVFNDNCNSRNTRLLLRKRRSGWWSCLISARKDCRKWGFPWVRGWGSYRKQGSRCAKIRFT